METYSKKLEKIVAGAENMHPDLEHYRQAYYTLIKIKPKGKEEAKYIKALEVVVLHCAE